MTVYAVTSIGQRVGTNGLEETFNETEDIDFMIKFFEKETNRVFGTTKSVVLYMDKESENDDKDGDKIRDRIYTNGDYQERLANI